MSRDNFILTANAALVLRGEEEKGISEPTTSSTCAYCSSAIITIIIIVTVITIIIVTITIIIIPYWTRSTYDIQNK